MRWLRAVLVASTSAVRKMTLTGLVPGARRAGSVGLENLEEERHTP